MRHCSPATPELGGEPAFVTDQCDCDPTTPVLGGGGAFLLNLLLDTYRADDTWTSPAFFFHPDGTANAVSAEAWGAGGGGTMAVGGGGGGGYGRSKITGLAPTTGYAVEVGGGLSSTDGGDSSFNAIVIGEGGKSGTNGGTGGSGTGDVVFDGGSGAMSAGATNGGGGAGDKASGALAAGGADTGGPGSTAVGRVIGAGGGSSAATGFAGARGEVRVTYDTVAVPGFPRVRGRSYGRDAADTTSRTANMPDGIVADELLLLVVSSDGNPDITVAGWEPLGLQMQSFDTDMAVFYKVAVGGDTATILTSAAESTDHAVWRIADAGIPSWATVHGAAANADSPALASEYGNDKYMWLSIGGWDNQSLMTASPANYGAVQMVPSRGGAGVELISTERFLETDVEDPGAFTSGAEQFVAATIQVPPASATIQASGASTAQDVVTTNVANYVRADLGVTESGGAVSAWANQAGAGSYTAAGGQEPTLLATDAPNNRPCVQGDGTEWMLDSAFTLDAPNVTPLTLWMIARLDVWVNNATLIASPSAGFNAALSLICQTATPQMGMSNESAPANMMQTVTLGEWFLFEVHFAGGANDSFKLASIFKGGRTSGVVAPTAGRALFARGTGGNIIQASIAEVLHVTRALTATERADLRKYAHTWYGSGLRI